jgi:hypothetical protein
VPFTYWVLFADLLALGGCLVFRSRVWAWLLLITSTAWLPANNKVLEGHVLFSVNSRHGLTESDLLGLVGIGLAAAVLTYRHGGQSRLHGVLALLTCVAALALGAVAAYLTG